MNDPLRELDKIHIRDLHLQCVIGINGEERNKKQDVVINIILFCNLQKACLSDQITDSVNYKTIKNEIISLVEQSSFFLLEKLTEEIACLCLRFPQVQKVTVIVDKPGALRFARSVAVEITRIKKNR